MFSVFVVEDVVVNLLIEGLCLIMWVGLEILRVVEIKYVLVLSMSVVFGVEIVLSVVCKVVVLLVMLLLIVL